jgi:hypothetical protein
MSETCTAYLRRLPPDVEQLSALIQEAIGQEGSPTRRYTVSAAVSVAQKLIEDLQRAEQS